jgi:hypothetical protein
MPVYVFENKKGQTTTQYFQYKDAPKIGSIIILEDGLEWKRIPSLPLVAFDTKVDPFSDKDFVKATAKGGTYGDLLDRSKEMSEQRADKNGGVDPIKEKYLDNQFEKTKIEPYERRKKKAKEKLDKMGVELT